MAHVRINMGWLARAERQALAWLAQRTPDWVTPDQLTVLGVIGAAMTMLALILCRMTDAFVLVALLGLFINWLGDSLDGTLARYRKIERPRIGYFIDHSCDLISQVFIFVGLGLSPYFTFVSGLLALSMYFMISCYTYLKVMILRRHQLAYGGMGATELRVAIACWSILAIRAGPEITGTVWMGYRVLDLVIGAAWGVIFIGFIFLIRRDFLKVREQFAEEENSAQPPAWVKRSGVGPATDGFQIDA